MRNINAALQARFESALQTAAANADPSAVVWISRPTIPLTDGVFLDQQTAVTASGLTACSVAVRRPAIDREADRIYLAYLDANGAHVKSAATQDKISDYVWQSEPFAEPADDVAIAFDGRMPKRSDGTAQFVTELRPWVFWIKDGVLKGRVLGLLGDVTLASSNAGRVSAVRAAWDSAANLDFGLVVFFTLSGQLYYRQLINNQWMDAERVAFGPSVSWADIAAFRTWDYRVGVQGLTENGAVYELFTMFEGLGKHGGEHVDFRTRARGYLFEVDYTDAQTQEHLELDVAAGAPYGGLYRTGSPSITAAENVADGADWGRVALFTFDRHLRAAEVAANPTAFHIVDALGGHFVAQSAQLLPDGKTVRLTFLNFNAASGECAATFIPGDVHTMADAALPALSFAFTPRNLVPPSVPAPAVADVENNGDTEIIVTFDRPLTGSLSGVWSHFTARFLTPEFSPGGELIEALRRPVLVTASGSDTLVLTFRDGNQVALNNAVGQITLEYDGAGPLTGAGGPVYPFAESFTPRRLTPKYNAGDTEHIQIRLRAEGTLTRIYWSEAAGRDHIALGVTASGALIHIKDL